MRGYSDMDASDGCSHTAAVLIRLTRPFYTYRVRVYHLSTPSHTQTEVSRNQADKRDTKDTTSFCASILESHKGNEVQPGRIRTAAQVHFQSIIQFSLPLPARGSDDALSSSFTEGVNLVVDRMV